MTTAHWPAPFSALPLDATVRIPASKSLTNRYLVLAAIAEGESRLRAPLQSRDSDLMIGALRALGAGILEVPGNGDVPDLVVTPIPADFSAPDSGILVDCGLAGTVMRFVPPLAALVSGAVRFSGDPAALVRPMAPIVVALEGLGVRVDDGEDGFLPFTVHGTGAVHGGHVQVDAGGSSQFISAILLVASRFSQGLHLEHIGESVPSVDHISMTVEILRSLGVSVDDSTPNHWFVKPASIAGFDVELEQDLSNAGPFLAAALATRGTVRIPNWPANTTQVGDKWREILPQFGATVTLENGVLTVTGGAQIRGVDISDTSELAPSTAAICALASTPSRLRGISHLRGHETDRLAALVAEINALGGDAVETEDGLIITPTPLRAGVFHSYHDHRMATAGAIIGLAVPGVEVENIGTTAKTMPGFPAMWADMVAQTAEPSAGTGSTAAVEAGV
ncbi:3-phosphoshikimate 1-carboxyvinyltransferase [Arthrobacter psychrochitiniphilus]|uniref:3-phosphoshikimate 1-carboxyvinyltransferase n=1 Tax=Arthrobacter psychrochitiniphilus TaxID=291045 RepID=A0A2V3DPQ7_9MICC|nr:3-phosphoshikimate 1-carboxyvinyltransferase [Arthrobacter psychrochitiniphilus]NYG18287.1 3-phosphoshikimate 1-carboxyvinyltransferase [Arthrobacter psychrochitiniphilus]PXA64925.1 3-phosphoshikimate 1-carboxyvinyltransferase [Arthrobacter psychrochitiniphilus]